MTFSIIKFNFKCFKVYFTFLNVLFNLIKVCLCEMFFNRYFPFKHNEIIDVINGPQGYNITYMNVEYNVY